MVILKKEPSLCGEDGYSEEGTTFSTSSLLPVLHLNSRPPKQSFSAVEVTEGKFKAPVAVYCGSVPHVKPGYKPARSGSLDSSMHLYGNDWRAVDMELFLPRLKPPVSERCVQSGESQKGVRHLVRGRPHQRRLSLLPIPISSRTQHPLSQPESQKLDKTGAKASSASLDSDTTWSQSMTRGSLEPDGAGTLPLRPAKACSPSQRPLNGFKPIPPIEPGSKKNSPPSEPISKPSPPHPALPENSKPVPPTEPSSTPSSPSEPISNPSSELGSKPTPIIKLCPGPVVMDRGGGKGGSASLSGGPAEKPRVGDSQDKLDESLPSGTLRRRKSLLPIPLLGVARSCTPSPHPPSQPGRSPEVCADRRLVLAVRMMV
ncbi:UNVERIFIED_CONTAM: hypothetical protein FKN15_052246 [Acipenser sinensis]